MEYECRTCLKVSEDVVELFSSDLPEKIEAISSVPIFMHTRQSSKICGDCEKNVLFCYEFRRTIVESNAKLEERYFRRIMAKVDETKLDWNKEKDAAYENMDQKVKEETVVQVSSESKSTPKQVMRRVSTKPKLYRCTRCTFTTYSKNLFSNHMYYHYERNVICDLCGVVLSKKNLQKHMIGLHTESPMACKVCNKVYRNAVLLQCHMYRHKQYRRSCVSCGKVYSSRTSYYSHLKQHIPNEAQKYACTVCEKRFISKYHLTKHHRTHTGEKPYCCQYCNKGFSTGSSMKTHLRQHTKEKPFVCALCNLAFTQKVSLKAHLQSKHPRSSLVKR